MDGVVDVHASFEGRLGVHDVRLEVFLDGLPGREVHVGGFIWKSPRPTWKRKEENRAVLGEGDAARDAHEDGVLEAKVFQDPFDDFRLMSGWKLLSEGQSCSEVDVLFEEGLGEEFLIRPNQSRRI